jgi:UrcA family protein
MNTNTIRTTITAAAMIAALTTGVRAADVPQVQVKYADLNVNTPAGAAALYQRIRFAADQVCALPNARNLAVLAKVQACTDQAVANAVAAVKMDQATRFAAVR